MNNNKIFSEEELESAGISLEKADELTWYRIEGVYDNGEWGEDGKWIPGCSCKLHGVSSIEITGIYPEDLKRMSMSNILRYVYSHEHEKFFIYEVC